MDSFRSVDSDSKIATRKRSNLVLFIEIIKYSYSSALLFFCAVVISDAAVTGQTTAAKYNIPGYASCIVLWFLVLWLSLIEGGQTCLVGLEAVDIDEYAQTHRATCKSTKVANKGDNLERFIVGNQFLIFLVIFAINFFASCDSDASVFGFSSTVNEIFLASGFSMILITIVIGQLVAQVNAEKCMLDFTNNYFMVASFYISLVLQKSGVMHAVYLVQKIFSRFADRPLLSNEDKRTVLQRSFFWFKVVFSFTILAASMAVVIMSFIKGWTNFFIEVPAFVAIITLFGLILFIGILEGMQIALFSAAEMPRSELKHNPIAKHNIKAAFELTNLRSFLCGRQILVTVSVFLIARITSINTNHPDLLEGQTIFGVPSIIQKIFNVGFMGVFATTIIGSLSWRVLASSFPLAFLSNPLVYVVIRLCIFIESCGVTNFSWVLARAHKVLFGLQPDTVYLENAEKETRKPITRRDKDIRITLIVLRVIYSMAILLFCVVLVMKAMLDGKTSAETYNIKPKYAIIIFWLVIIWLGVMEGGQGCLVGLYPVNKDYYIDSHPITAKCTSLAHSADNLERFIVGRQLLAILAVFVLHMIGTVEPGASYWGLPEIVGVIFYDTGIALILITVIIGQLTSQINAASSMLDFVDNWFMLFTTWLSFAVEFSGILHAVYLVQMFFFKITRQVVVPRENRKSLLQKIFFWFRVLVSLLILMSSLAVVIGALFKGWTNMWTGFPAYGSVFIFLSLMCAIGVLEGMQIALYAVVNLPEEELYNHKVAQAACKLAFQDSNLQAFLIGRQILYTVCMFVVAKITSFNTKHPEILAGETLYGLPSGVQNFFNLGLMGAIAITIIGSLGWRIIASTFPLAFLSNPLVYVVIRLCLVIEAIGICSAAWFLAIIQKAVFAFQRDQVYFVSWENHFDMEMNSREDCGSSNLEDTLVSNFGSKEVEVAFSSLGTREFSRDHTKNSDSFSLVAPPRPEICIT